jgi:hypothetical protein
MTPDSDATRRGVDVDPSWLTLKVRGGATTNASPTGRARISGACQR